MVVVLCDSFQDAEDAYDCYVSFLENYNPWMIAETRDACNCIMTTENIYYIFVDYRAQSYFDPYKNDIVDEGTFFDNLHEQYQLDVFV